MKRIPELIPYSHDHQHGLAVALRIRKAIAAGDDAALAEVTEQASAFATGELATHMEQEETVLLPQLHALGLVGGSEIERIAREHLELRVLTRSLTGNPPEPAMLERFAELLHNHIRWEERELFAAWQERLEENRAALAFAPPRTTEAAPGEVLMAPEAAGSSGLAAGDLNATAVTLAPDGTMSGAADRDVAIVALRGSGTIAMDVGTEQALEVELTPGGVTIVPAHTTRLISAGGSGLSFATVHRRRVPLQPRP